MSEPHVEHVDVLVAGLGLGAIAAALALTRHGRTVVMAGPESRIGGQITTQATAPLDEHPMIENAGCTATYRRLRDGIRAVYGGLANPGGGWVSHLCFEPAVGERVLADLLAPAVAQGKVRIQTGARIDRVEVEGDHIRRVHFTTRTGPLSVSADVVIDATETGDLLPLCGADWVVGSEGQDAFDEPHALPGGPHPHAEQSCTVVAALVRDAVAGPVGPAPAGYAALRDAQPFSLSLANGSGALTSFAFFDDAVAPGSFWSYRRVRDGAQLGGADAAVINWHGNDWYVSALTAEPERTDAAARELTAAFVHWLRTEAPRDDGAGTGYPELRLAPEISGTPDGLAEAPYVRESRRLASRAPVTEQDLSPRTGQARARAFDDTVGIAWYHADLHPRVGGYPSVYAATAPFQIPLRSLVPQPGAGPVNLIAGAKNLAATQIAAAAYRVHHGEWAVGEAAGALAVTSAARGASPTHIACDAAGRLAVQVRALRDGCPLVWASDLTADHPAFVAGSLLAAYGGLDPARDRELELGPDEIASPEAVAALEAAADRIATICGIRVPRRLDDTAATWADVARFLAAPILEMFPG